MPLRISVIGQSGPIEEPLRQAAHAVGQAIGASGALLFTGGRDGVMAACCKGARQAGGLTVGILPGDDVSQANEDVVIPITSGLTFEGRSQVLIHAADAFVVVGGGSGTLDEVCVAYLYRKPIVALRGCGGWGDRLESILLEGKYLDPRRLVPIHFVDEPAAAVELALRLASEAQSSPAPAAPASALGDVPTLKR